MNVISQDNKLFGERRYLEEWISTWASHRTTWRAFRMPILGSTSRVANAVHLGPGRYYYFVVVAIVDVYVLQVPLVSTQDH